MPRAPFNVLVIPYRLHGDRPEFAVFHRRPPSKIWQFIAGGGEDDETPDIAARREAREEAGVIETTGWIRLDSVASIPRTAFPNATWPESVYVIPEYCFAVEMKNAELIISNEHDGWGWCRYEQAWEILTWDSNKVALWELNERLRRTMGL
jgi:dATP pyrophosphohydrolase